MKVLIMAMIYHFEIKYEKITYKKGMIDIIKNYRIERKEVWKRIL